jgi:hypothetical protein
MFCGQEDDLSFDIPRQFLHEITLDHVAPSCLEVGLYSIEPAGGPTPAQAGLALG